MSKELNDISINKANNGYILRASYQDKKGKSEVCCYDSEQYVCNTMEEVSKKLKEISGEFEKDVDDVIDSAFEKKEEKEEKEED